MKKLVIDSSVIVKWLNRQNEERLIEADSILKDAMKGYVVLLAPELAKYEIGNALLIKRQLSLIDAETTFNGLYILPIQFVPQSKSLALATYKIAQEAGVTYYDASFMALARQEDAELITDNLKHQGKSKDIKVKSLKDYTSAKEL